jgi:hypothetical protein
VTVWPIFLWRNMHEDSGQVFGVGDAIAWDVVLIDGEADSWPGEILVDTIVRFEPRPAFALRGSIAHADGLALAWNADEPAGSTHRMRAGLVADFFNPPLLTSVTGIVQRIQIVTRPSTQDRRGVWQATGSWALADVCQSPRSLGGWPNDPAAPRAHGLLIQVDVHSHLLKDFPSADERQQGFSGIPRLLSRPSDAVRAATGGHSPFRSAPVRRGFS